MISIILLKLRFLFKKKSLSPAAPVLTSTSIPRYSALHLVLFRYSALA
jgi:hypothetical protein